MHLSINDLQVSKMMKQLNKNTYEKGQAIILVAFLMVGMLAMVGLAVDGGGLYFMDRDLQNAVDGAVMAATYAKCVGGDVEFAGHDSARKSGFVDGVDNVQVVVDPHYAPPGEPSGNYVYVSITAKKPSYFIQIVYDGPLTVTANGVGYCKVSDTAVAGKALFAACVGSDPNDDAIQLNVSGTCSGEIVGGIHSNANATGNEGLCVQGDVSTSGDASGLDGLVDTDGDGTYETDIDNTVAEGVPTADFPFRWRIEEFSLSTAKYPTRIRNRYGSDNYLSYTGTLVLHGDDLVNEFALLGLADPTLEPVLVYVNGDIDISRGTTATYYVTFVATGEIKLGGSMVGVNWANAGMAPVAGIPTNWTYDSSKNGMDYLFLYSEKNTISSTPKCKADGGTQVIKFDLNGTSWNGIIFAPDGFVQISGSSSQTSFGAIWAQGISYSVSNMTLVFDPEILPKDPPEIGFGK